MNKKLIIFSCAYLGSGRKGAAEIKAHNFFAHINWEKLANKKIDAPFKPQISHSMDTSNFEVLYTKQLVNNESSTPPLNSYTEIFKGIGIFPYASL